MSPIGPNRIQPDQASRKGLWHTILSVPRWLLLTAALTIGAGAATGIVFSDELKGTISITVTQALELQQPVITGLQPQQRRFASVSEDGSQFAAAAEAFTGDVFSINLPIANKGSGDIVAELIIIPPLTGASSTGSNITVDIVGFGAIDDTVQASPDVWKFTVDADAAGGISDGVILTISIGNAVEPGFFNFTGTIKARPF